MPETCIDLCVKIRFFPDLSQSGLCLRLIALHMALRNRRMSESHMFDQIQSLAALLLIDDSAARFFFFN